MIKELYDYFKDCPLLQGYAVNVDYLAPEVGSISLNPTESENIIKSYCGGGSLRQYCFSLSIRTSYNGTLADGLRNEQLCEELADWVEQASKSGNLPLLEAGLTPQAIEVTSGGRGDKESTNHAVYKIELRLIYTKM